MAGYAAWQAEIQRHSRLFQSRRRIRRHRHAASHALGGGIESQPRARAGGHGAAQPQIGCLGERPQQGLPHAPGDAEYRDPRHQSSAPVKNFLTPSKKLCSRGLWLPSCSEASNFLSNSFCSPLKDTGVSTMTRQNRSPADPPRTGRTPFSRSRNTRPDWVSAGILSTTSPSSVGTSTAPPSAAVEKLMGTSHDRWLPSRSKMLCSRTRISTYRSPAGPPLRPASPLPFRRIRSPVSTPAGTLTLSCFSCRTRPWP